MKEQGKDFDPSKEPVTKDTICKINNECKRLFETLGRSVGEPDLIRGGLVFGERESEKYMVRDMYIAKGTTHDPKYLNPGEDGYSISFPGHGERIIDDEDFHTGIFPDFFYHINGEGFLMGAIAPRHSISYFSGSGIKRRNISLPDEFPIGPKTMTEYKRKYPSVIRVAARMVEEFSSQGVPIETKSDFDYPGAQIVLRGEMPSPIRPNESQAENLLRSMKSLKHPVALNYGLYKALRDNPPF